MSNKTNKNPSKDFVIIRSYPETLFFYPSMIAAFIVWLLHFIDPNMSQQTSYALGTFFFAVFAFNFIIVAFDFGLGKTALIIAIIIIVILAYMLLRAYVPDVDFLSMVHFSWPEIYASEQFYLYYALLIFIHLILIFIYSRIDYWKISPTEIYHHRGILGDENRFGNAQHAHIEKKSPDIFEKLLFMSGDIYIKPDGDHHIYRISNVFRVDKKEGEIRDVLSYVPDKKLDV